MSQRVPSRSDVPSEVQSERLSPPAGSDDPAELGAAPKPLSGIRKASLGIAFAFLVTIALSWTGIADSSTQPFSFFDAIRDDGFFASTLLGVFLLFVTTLSSTKSRASVIALALFCFGAFHWLAPSGEPIHRVWRVFAALGTASLLAEGVSIARKKGSARARAFDAFLVPLCAVAIAALLPFVAELTSAFRPLTFDSAAFVVDTALGSSSPSHLLGKLIGDSSWLKLPLAILYASTPAALLFVYGTLRSPRDRIELLLFLLGTTLVSLACQHLVPMAGPAHAFRNFPDFPDVLVRGSMLVAPSPRSSLPALPLGWALVLYWQSRPGAMRVFATTWLALTVFASLALGHHTAIALIVTIPMTIGAMALAAPRIHDLEGHRLRALGAAVAISAAWVVIFHAGTLLFDIPQPFLLGAMLLSVALPWELQRRYAARRRVANSEIASRSAASGDTASGEFSLAWAMGAMFFVSGAAGLVYEVVFAKSLALTFGSTTRASTTVLATYMGGMAAGAWLGGRLARGKHRPLVVYAACEAGVAIWCALSPFILTVVQRLYVGLATGADPSSPWLGGLQVALGALVLLPPTMLMGITLPVVARQFEKRMALGRAIGLLYGANTLGAALASLCTGYFVLPLLGIHRTTWLAVLANFSAAGLALFIDSRTKNDNEKASPERAAREPSTQAHPETKSVEAWVAAVVLTVGGAVTLALEVVYIHLLAIVAGNSTYAFSLMLFAFLLGLGGGAAIGRNLLRKRAQALRYLGSMQLGLAACVLLGVFGWEIIPDYFASFGSYSFTRAFGARELVRAAVCCMAMIPPAIFIGAAYPLAMACRVEGASDPIRATGRASALNTLGNVTGAFLGSFVLVPYLGALRSLHLLACVATGLGLLAALGCMRNVRWKAAAPALAVVALFLAQPPAFNLNRLASGANVYFERQGYGKVVDHAESADGGLTMVTELHDRVGNRVLTLLTNGKFQGDDSQSREMAAQHGFALFPLLHTAGRERALVIGFGTGVSARAVDDSGFAHTDLVDLSEDIFKLADIHFQSVNGAVLHRPRVKAHTTDGRNFLLLTEDEYDLIGLEISSIWFSGAASLYNREFYGLVKSRLREGGVLQQWVQLHRLSPRDLASIFASLQAEFERVWLYFGAGQGVLVACNHDCEPNAETLARINQTETLRFALSSYGGTAEQLMQSKLLGPSEISAFVESLGIPREELVSTDDNLFLEYSTPRGNVRPYGSIRENVRMLSRFQGR